MQSPVVAVCAGYTRRAMASMAPFLDFRCTRCLGTARHIDGRTVKGVKVDEEKLEAVSEFCYLSAGVGCELAAVTCCCKCPWG